MATIRKRGGKWQAQVRRNGVQSTRSFTQRADALQWAREVELSAERQGSPLLGARDPSGGFTHSEGLAQIGDVVASDM